MKLTEEKGVTLVTLVTTIVLLLILTSIGATSGISTLNFAKFSQFKEELKILQTKVNEVNQNNEITIGQELTESQKEILNITEISNIIYNGKSEEEKNKIQNGFRYFDNNSLKNDLELEGIKRDYLINFEYRYVICCKGVEYNGITYYMANQIEEFMYMVSYNNKNTEETCTFTVNSVNEGNRWKIEVSNITYNGYVNNWKVKYRPENQTYWNTANNLSFYVTKTGNYYVQVVYGDTIKSEPQLVSIIDEIVNTTGNELENIIE